MISVAEAQARVLAEISRPSEPEVTLEAVPLSRALGRVLGHALTAPLDVPPTDNSAVDGYAVRGADLAAAGHARFRVVRDLAAGQVDRGVVGPRETVRIMTGAPMPVGADTVVPQELSRREGDDVHLAAVPPGSNVRARGEDVRAGDVVLPAGMVLRPQELGLVASLGHPAVPVFPRPRVAILSTGDEVVEPGQPRGPAQIFDANRYSLHGLVETAGCVPIDLGIVADARDVLRQRLLEAAASAQVVMTSGGVSVGDHDLVKQVLAEIGSVAFWQVAMQPGRPFAAGKIAGAHFFGLPGNPVASMLCYHLFVRPALAKLAGRLAGEPLQFQAHAGEAMRKKEGRREFKRGVLRATEGGLQVTTTGPQGSGILSSMVLANCLIVLDETRGDVLPGEAVAVELL